VKEVKNRLKKSFEKIPLGISEILPGFLYLGSSRDAQDIPQLSKYNIKHILNCAKEWKNAFGNLYNYHNLELMDIEDQNIIVALETAFNFIGKFSFYLN
jgi:hypothetical protein